MSTAWRLVGVAVVSVYVGFCVLVNTARTVWREMGR